MKNDINANDCKNYSPSLLASRQNKNNNPSSNKQDTNLVETYTSTKNKGSVVGALFKKIPLLEFPSRKYLNSVEFYLNNILKNKYIINSPINKNSNIYKLSQDIEETPYNV